MTVRADTVPNVEQQPTLIDVAELTQAQVAMATGPRQLKHPQLVEGRCVEVLTRLGVAVAVSGGAEGADTRFAEAALRVGCELELMLPNRWYRAHYPKSAGAHIVEAATRVVYVVSRPNVEDWERRWNDEKWWRDNFARNRAMLDRADTWIVISATHPRDLLTQERGGTAACVKEGARLSPGRRWVWVPDDPATPIKWVRVG